MTILVGSSWRGRSRSRCGRRGPEIHFGHFVRAGRSREIGIVALKTSDARDKAIRKSGDVGVVVLHSVVIAAALDRYAILGAREFVLQ